MKYVVFTVYDRKAGIYFPVFLSLNEVTGIRDFRATMSKNPYAEDMELYSIGFYDSDTGIITANDKPHFVVAYSSFAEED